MFASPAGIALSLFHVQRSLRSCSHLCIAVWAWPKTRMRWASTSIGFGRQRSAWCGAGSNTMIHAKQRSPRGTETHEGSDFSRFGPHTGGCSPTSRGWSLVGGFLVRQLTWCCPLACFTWTPDWLRHTQRLSSFVSRPSIASASRYKDSVQRSPVSRETHAVGNPPGTAAAKRSSIQQMISRINGRRASACRWSALDDPRETSTNSVLGRGSRHRSDWRQGPPPRINGEVKEDPDKCILRVHSATDQCCPQQAGRRVPCR